MVEVRGVRHYWLVTAVVLVVGFRAEGLDGRTVQLAGAAAGIALLRAACEGLADGTESISLGALDWVGLESVADVRLRRARRPGRLQLSGGDPPTVVFDGSAEQWATRARLLDPLVERAGPGFHYLDYDSLGDAGVVVEKTE
jgi:hypothetical protein